jgi:hypothetical protein
MLRRKPRIPPKCTPKAFILLPRVTNPKTVVSSFKRETGFLYFSSTESQKSCYPLSGEDS